MIWYQDLLLRKRRSPNSRILAANHVGRDGSVDTTYVLLAPHRTFRDGMRVRHYCVEVKTFSQMQVSKHHYARPAAVKQECLDLETCITEALLEGLLRPIEETVVE